MKGRDTTGEGRGQGESASPLRHEGDEEGDYASSTRLVLCRSMEAFSCCVKSSVYVM